MRKQICGVYKIVNIVNDKIYVGSSKDIEKRWDNHRTALNERNHANTYLQNAWNKYGSANFRFEIIEECEPSIQFEREQYYLDLLKPFDDIGYNIVRRISSEYSSDNYMTKKCEMCGKDYSTFSHLSKYCDECKKEKRIADYQYYQTWVRNNYITTEEVKSWGYDGWDDFWESHI